MGFPEHEKLWSCTQDKIVIDWFHVKKEISYIVRWCLFVKADQMQKYECNLPDLAYKADDIHIHIMYTSIFSYQFACIITTESRNISLYFEI